MNTPSSWLKQNFFNHFSENVIVRWLSCLMIGTLYLMYLIILLAFLVELAELKVLAMDMKRRLIKYLVESILFTQMTFLYQTTWHWVAGVETHQSRLCLLNGSANCSFESNISSFAIVTE